MQHTLARIKTGVIKSHRVTQHDAAVAKGRGQRFVGTHLCAGFGSWIGLTGVTEAIGFGFEPLDSKGAGNGR